jgi:hypothetical protein
MHERIRLITHHGKQIVVVDLSNCSARDVETIVRSVPEYLTTQPSVQSCCFPTSLEHPLITKLCG